MRDRDLSAQDIEKIFKKNLGVKTIKLTPIYLRLKKLEKNELVRSYRYEGGKGTKSLRSYFQLTIKGQMLLEQLEEFRNMLDRGLFS